MSDEKGKKSYESILDDSKLRLYSPKQQGMTSQPYLRWKMVENQPHLIIQTQVPNDANNGKIEVGYSLKAFAQVMELIRLVGALSVPGGFEIENWGHPWFNKERSKEKKLTSKTLVEKGEDGFVSVTVSAGTKRPLITFRLESDDYHPIKNRDGSVAEGKIAGRIAAVGYANQIEQIVNSLAADKYAVPEWLLKRRAEFAQGRQNGGGFGGGNNYGNNQGGGYQNNQRPQQGGYQQQAPQGNSNPSFDDFGDDIPM